jgi:hypothetical protein
VALSTDDLNAVRAQWEEWVPDGYRLDIQVAPSVGLLNGDVLGVRVQSPLYCQVEIYAEPDLAEPIFSQRCPYDHDALRASVTVLARTIAQHQLPAVEGDEGE